MNKYGLMKHYKKVLIVTALISLFLGEFAGIIRFNFHGYTYIPGNGITRALPYMLLGRFLYEKREALFSRPSWKYCLAFFCRYPCSNRGESDSRKNGLPVELHDVLIKYDENSTKKQLRFFRDPMPYVKENTLDWNYHFLFMIAHLRKHFLFSGVGIRQFMDIAVLIKDGPDLDWKWIEKKLGELEMRRFAHACFSLIEYWFGITPPISFKRMDGLEEMTEKIIGNGVFGEADPDNKKNWVRNFLIMEKRPVWVNRIVLLKKNFFPGYDFMVDYPGCGFIENRKYLIPFAWIVRFGRLIRPGEHKKAVNTIRRALLSRHELKDHSERIRKMGL